jgi:SAM-dependent methyltransferase
MRNFVVQEFLRTTRPFWSDIKTVVVVGGSQNDPEVVELRKHIEIEIQCYGIDDDDKYFDLNEEQQVETQFDLVICSQVLEHIWDLNRGISNLLKLTRSQGFLWIGCPASNRAHGSPNYYSAGYQPELISNLVFMRNSEVLKEGRLGSERVYFMTHALRVWPSEREWNHPILGYNFKRLEGSLLRKTARFVRDLPGRFYSLRYSKTMSDKVESATETFVLAKKRD